jgi:hypothetical protein
MRRLTYSVAALTLGALPVVGLAATASAAGALADGGVISANTASPVHVLSEGGVISTNTASPVHVLADGGVISTDAVIGSGSAIRPADDGVVNSRD